MKEQDEQPQKQREKQEKKDIDCKYQKTKGKKDAEWIIIDRDQNRKWSLDFGRAAFKNKKNGKKGQQHEWNEIKPELSGK